MEMNSANVEAVVKQVLESMLEKKVPEAAPAQKAAGNEIPKTAHVAMLTALEHFEIKEYPMPEVGDGDILVKVEGCGVCGTDAHEFKRDPFSLIPVVPSVAQAKKMEKIGASAVIAEGMESGGHIGKLTTMALVPQVVDALSIPVLAAGGIADGRGMAAGFMLGAEGVQIGTRFLVATECTVHENYKAKILKANDLATVITGQITGHPVRVIKNKLANAFLAAEKEERNWREYHNYQRKIQIWQDLTSLVLVHYRSLLS